MKRKLAKTSHVKHVQAVPTATSAELAEKTTWFVRPTRKNDRLEALCYSIVGTQEQVMAEAVRIKRELTTALGQRLSPQFGCEIEGRLGDFIVRLTLTAHDTGALSDVERAELQALEQEWVACCNSGGAKMSEKNIQRYDELCDRGLVNEVK